MSYRGVMYAASGYMFAGVTKRLASSWFATRKEAEDWLYAMTDGQEHKIDRMEVQQQGDES